jgi:small subunit ribosomal protein S17
MAETSSLNSLESSKRGRRKTRIGVVSSDKAERTITVRCSFSVKHPKYQKYVRRRTTLHVHDEANEAEVGDRVEIRECRPISKTKSWRLVRVIGSGSAVR